MNHWELLYTHRTLEGRCGWLRVNTPQYEDANRLVDELRAAVPQGLSSAYLPSDHLTFALHLAPPMPTELKLWGLFGDNPLTIALPKPVVKHLTRKLRGRLNLDALEVRLESL